MIYLLTPVQNRRWLEPVPAAQGTGETAPWTECPSMQGDSHMATLTRGPHRHTD